MRVAHLADLHLGFRQYQRVAPGGRNQREADVAATFAAAIDRLIAIRPDAIVVAGDVFHLPRPTNSAILLAFHEFTRLTRSLPDTPVVVVAGNHDTPRTIETGGILQLLEPLGVHVVDREARRLEFRRLDLSVLAVPDAGAARPKLDPGAHARFNVMVLHGEVEGMLPSASRVDRSAVEIPASELGISRWDYIALGHYHVYREIAPNAYYSGSIDYTSSNVWGELDEERAAGVAGKGFIERDLVTGAHTFHSLAAARPLVDLPRLDAAGMTAAEIDAAILRRVERCPGGIGGKIVRLVVVNLPRNVSRSLDHRALRDLRRHAMHLRLDLRVPERARAVRRVVPIRAPSLDERVAEHLRGAFVGSPEFDRAELLALASRYLEAAGERATRDGASEAAA